MALCIGARLRGYWGSTKSTTTPANAALYAMKSRSRKKVQACRLYRCAYRRVIRSRRPARSSRASALRAMADLATRVLLIEKIESTLQEVCRVAVSVSFCSYWCLAMIVLSVEVTVLLSVMHCTICVVLQYLCRLTHAVETTSGSRTTFVPLSVAPIDTGSQST